MKTAGIAPAVYFFNDYGKGAGRRNGAGSKSMNPGDVPRFSVGPSDEASVFMVPASTLGHFPESMR